MRILKITLAGLAILSFTSVSAQSPDLPLEMMPHGLRWQKPEALRKHKVKAIHIFKYREGEESSGASGAKNTFVVRGEADWLADLEFDETGKISKVRQRNDEMGHERIQFVYDEDGNLERKCTAHESFSTGEPGEAVCEEYEYDENGRLARYHPIEDGGYSIGNSGWITHESYHDYEYDEAGRIARKLHYSNRDVDKAVQELSLYRTHDHEYNGDLLERIRVKDEDEKPYQEITFEYDDRGLTTAHQTRYSDGSAISRTTFKYDEKGRLIYSYYLWTRGDIGTPDSESSWSYHYAGNGLLDRLAFDYSGEFTDWDWQLEYEFYE